MSINQPKLKKEQRLSQRVVKSGFWAFVLRITDRVFYLIRLVVLARILSPKDFGLMGIAMLTMLILENFFQTGFQAALVQKKENIESYLDTAWSTMIIRGFILSAILYFVAPYAATFFKSPQAKPIIQIIGLSILIQAFTNIGIIYFQKELEFNKQFIYQLSGTLADFIVAIVTALILRNVWALLFGLLVGNFVRFVVSYFIHPYRPRIRFDFRKMKELSGFGKWVFGSNILLYLTTQGDSILVGKILGTTMLGFYQMGYRISNMPATEISHVISQVTFPAYSKLQDNIPKLREAYLKVLQFITFLSFPIAGLIFVLSPDFIGLFLGEKWIPMVPAMQVLVFAGLVRSIAATTGYIFYAVGRPKIDTILQTVRLLILAVLIYPLTIKWGILGSSIAVFLSIFIPGIGFNILAIKITRCDVKNFTKTIMFPLINTTIVVLFVLMLKTTISIGMVEFIFFVLIAIIAYLLISYVSDKLFDYRIQTLIKDSIQSFRSG